MGTSRPSVAPSRGAPPWARWAPGRKDTPLPSLPGAGLLSVASLPLASLQQQCWKLAWPSALAGPGRQHPSEACSPEPSGGVATGQGRKLSFQEESPPGWKCNGRLKPNLAPVPWGLRSLCLCLVVLGNSLPFAILPGWLRSWQTGRADRTWGLWGVGVGLTQWPQALPHPRLASAPCCQGSGARVTASHTYTPNAT